MTVGLILAAMVAVQPAPGAALPPKAAVNLVMQDMADLVPARLAAREAQQAR